MGGGGGGGQAYRPLDRQVDCSSFHCGRAEAMSLAHIDPSLALGFYCDDKSDFDDLCRSARARTRPHLHTRARAHTAAAAAARRKVRL